MFNILRLVFLPIVGLSLKAKFLSANTTSHPLVEIPTLADLFISFMDDDIELYGRKITWDEVIIMMKDISKTMEHNADIFNKHVKIMETLSELVNTIKLYQKKDKLTIEERKFLLAMMGNQAFHVATHGGIPREEKVELFEMLAHEYKFFKEIFNRALEVTHDFHDMWPLMTKVSDRVRNAYLLILRMTMDQWDRQSVKNLDAKLHKVFITFTSKDHEDLANVGISMLENRNFSPEEQEKLLEHMIAGYQHALKY